MGHLRTLRHVLLAATAAITLAGCSSADETSEKVEPAEVQVTTVQPASVDVSDEFPGRVVAWRIAEIRPQVGGIVQRRLFEQGAQVRAGQPLFQIAPAPFRAAADSALANLQRAQATYTLAKTQTERLRPLAAADAVSKQTFDNAVAQRDQSAAEVAQARAELAQRRLDVGFARITSPISGIIGAALVTEGGLVGAQDTNPLATVQQIDKVYVDVRQPADRFDALRQAMMSGRGPKDAKVEILSASGTPYPVTGRILFSGTTVDAGTGSAVVRVEVDNPHQRLLPGMFVRARLPRMTLPDALTVPQQAVTRDNSGKATVGIVQHGGRVKERVVEVGDVVDGRYVVLSGLKRGETVVVVGRDRVQPGVPVNARPWRATSR